LSKCIDDVLDGARDGAAVGGAIGVGGGPATAGASAAGGAIIGGSLGGLKCSRSNECNTGENKSSPAKFTRPPGDDLDRGGTQDIAQYLKNKRQTVVNNGPSRRRGQ
jgi:hypothetical protein